MTLEEFKAQNERVLQQRLMDFKGGEQSDERLLYCLRAVAECAWLDGQISERQRAAGNLCVMCRPDVRDVAHLATPHEGRWVHWAVERHRGHFSCTAGVVWDNEKVVD